MSQNKVIYANMDGDEAAANASYPFIETTFLYPITPATAAAELVEKWAAEGRKNIFGEVPVAREMQAEGGVAGAMHGAGVSGTLSATFTSSQGLLLMIPNMYKLAYEMVPCVIHVASRLVAHHAMCLYCDYSDVFACRDTGFSFMCSADQQECLDLGTISHLVAAKCRIPFLHFFDGLRTSHEIQKIQTIPDNAIKELFPFKEVEQWRETQAMSTDHPTMRGCGQNGDIWWLCSERTAPFFKALPDEVESMMEKFAEKTGRRYHVVDYYGAPDAEDVIVVMGSAANTVMEVVSYINRQVEAGKPGRKVGVIKVRLFRPFPAAAMLAAIPKTCKRLCVLDRVKQVTAAGEPMFLETLAAIHETDPARLATMDVIGGKFGVGGCEFNPMHVIAVFNNLKQDKPKRRFCVGIEDDISHTSLPIGPVVSTVPEGTVQAKFFGLGADGTVGSCKSAIQMIGEGTDMYTQGYFVFDAKKTGGFTFNHLRFGKERILSEYEIYDGDYVACHHHSFLTKFNVTESLKDGGIFVLNAPWNSKEEIEAGIPAYAKSTIANRNAKFYLINAFDLAEKLGLRGHINMIMSVCFFALSKVIPVDKAIEMLKASVRKMYSKKGEAVVKQNTDAIDMALSALKPYEYNVDEWKNVHVGDIAKKTGDSFMDEVVVPILRQEAQKQPVSAMTPVATGIFKAGTARTEKRGVATHVPHWNEQECIQCNTCAFVCPHSVIRPFVFNKEESEKAPKGFIGVPLKGTVKPIEGDEKEGEAKEWFYRIQVSARDCLQCGLCVSECPKKCLTWRPFLGGEGVDEDDANWEFGESLPKERIRRAFTGKNPKDSQFQQPLLEFHAACAGCNQPGHMKVITQLMGGEVYLSNAVGCSMIWGGYTPTSPYTTDVDGVGPVYATSLFEDNAEFALGMSVSVRKRRNILKGNVEKAIAADAEIQLPENIKNEMQKLLESWDDYGESHKIAVQIKKDLSDFVPKLESDPASPVHKDCSPLRLVYHNRDLLARKYVWVPGGDGWAYDIDFHGVDHLLHSGEDVNVLILDTEVYSNTGGQASKATPRTAQAKLATAGKLGRKKDFGLYAMQLGCCYVASVCIGGNRAQYIKAVMEAASFDGPSILIAYCPCIAHNVKGGLTNSLEQQRLAVKSGYWPLYRYDPRRIASGENPLMIDSVVDVEKDGMDGEWKNSLYKFLGNELRFTMALPSSPPMEERMKAIAEDVAEKNTKIRRMIAVFNPK
ncbi:pyruvate-ferrodoxin oxidoreductase (PFO) [Monocercomonoides exilis]|uniref:pyruvate-ferrodoxin oxidoreductase (PFO) n=1 Tax=Monocercomonoides exilis TaxID=2049356 RepID=UPI003559BC1C|nr:pyruvate-ferrodoxin oxidoreductase (PFO) [Monocercomonoides exilis]|eukprot:MONOS_6709.1-p1 / transcript=MONOS_6709.1 / gene=MONOS_6709 / organism=Monocercomonoides_exilis_PA203 / gene_product=pyruvate-ferrodoxin oxidoreductase (PFO) / transcript_product=pyruvate-ferrodoxin oxidoreductase (PFO) / location=Mono_scaffold00216:40596-44285(+) / protein_length=1230 / sequence_SO=supercontig / SO=protein_coding / is_pseudo=false